MQRAVVDSAGGTDEIMPRGLGDGPPGCLLWLMLSGWRASTQGDVCCLVVMSRCGSWRCAASVCQACTAESKTLHCGPHVSAEQVLSSPVCLSCWIVNPWP